MPEAPTDKDQEKGDEVLRRLLKTPPDPKTGKDAVKKRLAKGASERTPALTAGMSRGEAKS